MYVELLARSNHPIKFQIVCAPEHLLIEIKLSLGDFITSNEIGLIINRAVNLGCEIKICCPETNKLNCKYINSILLSVKEQEEKLLDKPFERLTRQEWNLLKEYKPELKIDSINDIFGDLYRIWNGAKLLGTFYQNLEGLWVSQSCNSTANQKWLTQEDAINAIAPKIML